MKFRVSEWQGEVVELEAESAVEAALAYELAHPEPEGDPLELREKRLESGDVRTASLFVQSMGELNQWLPHVAEYNRADLASLVAKEKAPRILL